MVFASVIIPTHNYANFICEAIYSVLEQECFGGIEIIVVDDGSTDNTIDVLKHFIENWKIKYFFQENRGKASATNFAIQQSIGKYIFNLDADDTFLPGKIKASVAIYESDDTIVHVGSPAKIFYNDKGLFEVEKIPIDILNKPLDGNWLLHYFYNANILFGGGTTYSARASVLKKIIIPDAVDMYIDEFLIVAILPFGKSYIISEALSVWRIHTNNYSVGQVTKERKIYKAQRLLKSSNAMLSYVQNNNYTKELLKIYRLKNLTETITVQETENKKSIGNIIQYAFKTFIILRPGLHQIKKYHVINRLIPTSVFKLLKHYFKNAISKNA